MSEDVSADLTALSTLLGGYLHQDWPDEYPDVWSAVTAYRVDETAQGVAQARAEVAGLLATPRSEEELAELVAGLGCSYWAPADGYTWSGWLAELYQRLG